MMARYTKNVSLNGFTDSMAMIFEDLTDKLRQKTSPFISHYVLNTLQ